jgi:hypothetical protein
MELMLNYFENMFAKKELENALQIIMKCVMPLPQGCMY